jgi:hypothetical protein
MMMDSRVGEMERTPFGRQKAPLYPPRHRINPHVGLSRLFRGQHSCRSPGGD